MKEFSSVGCYNVIEHDDNYCQIVEEKKICILCVERVPIVSDDLLL